jgi:hypothetical protein
MRTWVIDREGLDEAVAKAHVHEVGSIQVDPESEVACLSVITLQENNRTQSGHGKTELIE